MRILIVTQYFWPENFRINDLALALTERGHHVEILTGKPNYPHGKFYQNYSFFSGGSEMWNTIKIHRSALIPRGNAGAFRLILNYLSFSLLAMIKGVFIQGSFDKIFVYMPSPITVGFPGVLMKNVKKAPLYFWVQDLWPHSVTAAGGMKNKFVIQSLESITRWVYKNSDRVLIQSEAFRALIKEQNVSNDKIIYYPNSVEKLFKVVEPREEIIQMMPKGFKIMFAGNIGESQDFETIVETAKILAVKYPDIKWIILGDGRKRSFLESRILELGLVSQIFLLGSFPVEHMPEFFACADCLLVSLKEDYIFSLTIPSKVQSYLACGKPILASLNGEGGRIIQEAKAGIVVEAENPVKLAKSVIELYNLPEIDLAQMGISARRYFEENFEREILVDRLESIFNEV